MFKRKVTPLATIPGDTGDSFPQILETDIGDVGVMAQAGDAAIVDDFVIKPGGLNVVEGGDFQLGGGLTLNIFKPLRMWRGADGAQFEDPDSAVTIVTIAPANSSLDRIDLIYVKFEENRDDGNEIRHYKKDPATPTSLEGDVSVETLKTNKLSVLVITGTPAVAPAVPDTPSDGAAMFQVTVRAGATTLVGNDILDLRHNFDTLEEVNERLAVLEVDVNKEKDHDHRHPADHIDVDAPANALGPTVQDVLNALIAKSDEDVVDPVFRPQLIRPPIPVVLPSDDAFNKLGSVGVFVGGIASVDIPIGESLAFFGTPKRKIEPGAFPAVVEATSLNARIVNKDAAAATNSRSNQIPLSLSVITPIASDGGGAWELQGYAVPGGRARSYYGQRMAAARDERYIEIMGGGPITGDNAWFTVDTVGGTVTQRAFTGDIPNFFIRFACPVGDGVHILMAQQLGADGGVNGGKLEWFLVNAVTGVSVMFTGVAPGYTAAQTQSGGPAAVIGDLISPNVIMILICCPTPELSGDNSSFGDNKVWFYHVETGTFEKITPIGQNPLMGLNVNAALQDVDFCMYKPGQGVLVRGISGIQTHRFDYPTKSWTRLNISQPTPDIAPGENRLIGLSIGNVNGRPQMSSQSSSIWELTPSDSAPQWANIGLPVGLGNPATASGRGFPGLVGMLATGLPRGTGFLIGGRVNNQPKNDIWKFASGGIVDVTCGGVAGIGLGGGTTQATFRVSSIALPWSPQRVLTNPIGNLPAGSIRMRYSFDGGVTFMDVPRDAVTTIPAAGANPTPIVEVTLIGTASVRPCVSRLNELFEQTGAPGLVSTVVRFDVILAGVRYLYMSRTGVVTIETTFQETTTEKAVLCKITPAGAAPPVPFDYVNARRIRRKYFATKSGGVNPTIANDFPVLPAYIKAWRVVTPGTTGDVFNLADPTVTLNTAITILGLADTESVILELEA